MDLRAPLHLILAEHLLVCREVILRVCYSKMCVYWVPLKQSKRMILLVVTELFNITSEDSCPKKSRCIECLFELNLL